MIGRVDAGAGAGIAAAEVVIGCDQLDATLDFFLRDLGFELELISPAEQPTTAVIAGHGIRLRLRAGLGDTGPGRLRLRCHRPELLVPGGILVAPNGTVVEVVAADPPLVVPPPDPRFELAAAGGEPGAGDRATAGRAGMQYRDLLPSRQGGRFVASHIAVPAGGPVADYVHYHLVRFQMIYCYRGWVRVVYEGQGPPFVLAAGDCVLQPPGIRHRVLESSPGLEVIEVTCPAAHDTMTDPGCPLPSAERQPDRRWDGQRFVHHVAAEATWAADGPDGSSGHGLNLGLEARDTGIGAATDGLAAVRVLRPVGGQEPARLEPATGCELELLVVLEGEATVRQPGAGPRALSAGDAVALPGEPGYALAGWSPDAEVLEVALPAGHRLDQAATSSSGQ